MRLPTMMWTGSVALVWDQVPGAPMTTQRMYAFEPEANRWRTLTEMPRSYYAHEAGLSAGRLVFIDNAGAHVFDPEANTFTTISPPVDLRGCTSLGRATWESERVVFSTLGACATDAGSIAVLEPRAGTWKTQALPLVPIGATLPATAPPARFNGLSVWNGKNVIVWGGAYALSSVDSCQNVPPDTGCDPAPAETVPTRRGYLFTPAF
jgi:hypothetical protein